MKILVNNQAIDTESDTKLGQIISRLIPNPRNLIVEINGKIIRKEYWDRQNLSENDRLEVIQMVGGG